MAAYSAFVVLRGYAARNPCVDIATAIDVIRRTSADEASLDYIGGAAILAHFNGKLPDKNERALLRFVACELVMRAKPWWLRLVPYGREKVRVALSEDQAQCLREAGLFDAMPDAETIEWWDNLAATMRGVIDTEKTMRGREAERLSLRYEHQRLERIGINLEPKWISIEDNTLGYDILSYDLSGSQVVNRLIEVKSTTSDSIFVSRNEWRNAASAESSYFFQVWKLPEKRFVEYPVSMMKANIPVDQGSGAWQDVRIVLDI